MGEGTLLWHHGGGDDPNLDLAREEVLLDRASRGPSLLTWSWDAPALVLGFGQGVEGVDLGFCQREGVRVLRRCSGGTGVLHRGDLCASLLLPPGHPWAPSIRPLYDRFVGAFEEVLSASGVPTDRPAPAPPAPAVRSLICFEDRSAETLLAGGRKVLGCAQAKRASGTLVHGTLLLCENSSLYAGVFRVSRERVRAALGPVPGGPHAARPLARRLGETLAEHLGARLSEGPLEDALQEEALALEGGRRADRRWNLAGGRSP